MIINQIKSPNRIFQTYNSSDGKHIVNIFTAGSIEMGKAVDWQTQLVNELANNLDGNTFNPTSRDDGPPITVNVFNPRRDNWDSSWKQEFNNSQFNEQVTWELDMLDRADIIPLYFAKDTQSPISLLELGLHAQSGKLIVYCDDTFWRKGNIEIVCSRYGIPLFNNYEAWVTRIRNKIIEMS